MEQISSKLIIIETRKGKRKDAAGWGLYAPAVQQNYSFGSSTVPGYLLLNITGGQPASRNECISFSSRAHMWRVLYSTFQKIDLVVLARLFPL
jgi:hypothetical protein